MVTSAGAGFGPGVGSNRAPWFVLQHVDFEGPGSIAPVLAERGVEVRVARLDTGDPLPRVDALSGLVVMGGPMGVGDERTYEWLAPERTLLAEAVARGVPVLAACLGAQQLAAALGAEVRRGPAPEIGPGQVALTAAGRRDRVFGPEYGGLSDGEVPCFHWHGDTFDLPDGAVHLAATAAYPHQAFRVGELAYALQFHVEVDGALADGWRRELPDGVTLSATQVARIEATGRRLIGRFVDVALGSGGQDVGSAASRSSSVVP
jgi:GMP synthase-like glutamine amidotransferase